MPTIKKDESESDYLGRCIPYCISNEGLSKDAATAKCMGMYREHQKKGTNYIEEQKDFNFTFNLQLSEPEQTLNSTSKTTMSETDKWIKVGATAIVGDRMMNGYFIPYNELKKSLNAWNGTLHDVSHLGTAYPDSQFPYKRENIEYVVGYQKNAQANDETKEITMDVYINKKSPKYDIWKSFIDISKESGRTPNVSVSISAKPKEIKATELNYYDKLEYGAKENEMILCLTEIIPKALTTCIKGACDDKRGCGLSTNHTEIEHTDEINSRCLNCKNCKCGASVDGVDEKMSKEDSEKLSELKKQIKKLKEEK
jgi:hypothetical protein